MGLKIGIPRNLFYYKLYPFWETFFQELGMEIVHSEPTNKRILDDGVRTCVDEACLPIKLFHGHVLNLSGKTDVLFIPRYTSISKGEYVCPEFGGLPDMVRHTLKGLPHVIDTEIDLRRSHRNASKVLAEISEELGCSAWQARKAFGKAMDAYTEERYQALCGTIPFNGVKGTGQVRGRSKKNSLRIGVIGHPYNLYDPYVSMDLIGKLKQFGAEIRTMEMVRDESIDHYASQLYKPMFWNFGRRAYGAAMHLLHSKAVDGLICVASFGCGIDAFVYDLIGRKAGKEHLIPLITLTIDEHTGEAGLNTRLEAFVDMLQWR